MNNWLDRVRLHLLDIDRRTALLLVTVLLLAMFVLIAGAPCGDPGKP